MCQISGCPHVMAVHDPGRNGRCMWCAGRVLSCYEGGEEI